MDRPLILKQPAAHASLGGGMTPALPARGAADDRDRLVTALAMLACGLRASEVAELTVCDPRFDYLTGMGFEGTCAAARSPCAPARTTAFGKAASPGWVTRTIRSSMSSSCSASG